MIDVDDKLTKNKDNPDRAQTSIQIVIPMHFGRRFVHDIAICHYVIVRYLSALVSRYR